MLRQVWRQRGAYNVVNLPFAASQDEPGSSPGRADRSSDWRRHYNPSLEPEFREDVGLEAWDTPTWYADRNLSSTAAGKILRKRLQTYGPQKERTLQEVISRIRSEKDAVMALKTAELFRRYRASREQHTPFKNATAKMIVQRALDVDAGDVAVQALARKDELGFTFVSLKAYRHAITHFSTKGDLKNAMKVFDLARAQGLKPNRDIAFCILRACLDCGRADLALAYASEFEANGLRISQAQRIKIEADSGKRLPPPSGDAAAAEAASAPAAEAKASPAEGEAADETDEAVVKAVADRIIAAATAASSSSEAPLESSGPSSSTSSTGQPEVAVSATTDEAAGSNAPSSPAAGARVAAAVSVEPDPQTALPAPRGGAADPPATAAAAEQPLGVGGLRLQDVPGLEEAVAEKMRLLFPPKPKKAAAPELRRASSL